MTRHNSPIMDTVLAYYEALPTARTVRLKQIEARILALYPDVKVSLKYKMPTFESADGWLSIGNQKQHCALYTCHAQHIQCYIDMHPGIDHGKGCLRFKDQHEVDLEALDSVIQCALGER